MESYSALAASYDELTQDVGYEKLFAFSTSPAAPAR